MYGFVSATIGFDEQDAELSEKVKLINKMKKAAKRIRESVKIRDKMYAQDLHAPYDNPINVIVKVKTYDNTMDVDVYIKDGELHYYDYLEPEADYNAGTVPPPDEFFHKSTVIFGSMEILKKYEASDLDASIRLMTTDVWVEGNPAAFSYLSYLFSLTEPDASKALITEQKEILKGKTFAAATEAGRPDRDMRKERMAKLLVADSHDPGVCHIQEEQFLAKYTLDQFPRLESMKKDYLAAIPEVTSEQGELLTEYFMQHGYDKKADGTPWHPALRSAHGFRHLMSHKKPVLRENDLIAGTLTPNPICGSITTPFTIGWSIWGDLEVMEERSLEAYTITEKTKTALSKKVFPFWMDKHIMQVWKDKVAQDIPDAVAPRLNDRLFFMIPWSLMSLNPSCPDFDGVVKYGLQGFRQKIEESREAFSQEPAETGEALQDRQNRLDTLDAMKIALEGVSEYVKRLAEQVGKEAQAAKQAIEVKKAQPS
ncbi:MAG: pyruvate formate lyase family protein, partial [Gammaproteobacteria bacterium]